MKKYIAIFTLLIILSLPSLPVFGAPASQSTDRKLSELSNRFNNLEATWGRFQLGGSFNIQTESDLDSIELFKVNQELNLFLDAFIDQNLIFSLKMLHRGGWGLNFQSLDSENTPLDPPVVAPLQIDEAFLRMERSKSLNYLGRFRYSFGPFGLISDFFASPAEGLAYQRSFGDYHILGLYSRVYTQYIPGSDKIEVNEDYLAGRVGWSSENTVLGLNLVPFGVAGEKNVSIDWSTANPTSSFAAELGFYSFNSDQYPDYVVDWTPGLLISYKKQYAKNGIFQVKAGYFAPNFAPSYSSLAHSSGDNREWFLPNSQGVDLFLLSPLPKNYQLANHLILLNQLEDYDQPENGYRLRSSIVKYYSPINQLEFGIDLNHLTVKSENQAFISWTVQF
ncbi:MAG: hypothetical protein ACM3YE_03480 [Bacteroidota bacterium]